MTAHECVSVCAHYLSVFENSLGPVEQQQTNITVSEAEVALQDL